MTSVLDLMSETPLIEVTQFDRGPVPAVPKLESTDPVGLLASTAPGVAADSAALDRAAKCDVYWARLHDRNFGCLICRDVRCTGPSRSFAQSTYLP